MAEYQLQDHGFVLRTADRAWIPDDIYNRDRQEFIKWVADGNTPDPAPPPIVIEEMPDANERLDSGVNIALGALTGIRNAMNARSDTFSETNFTAIKQQLDLLTDVLVALLEAQQSV